MTVAKVAETFYDYKIHPLAKLLPDLSPDEFKKLKADIEKNGQVEPIWVEVGLEAKDAIILDGRHRLRACKELGIKPHFKQYSHYPREEKKPPLSQADFIWSKNVLRRHLTADQRAAIAAKWSDAEKEAAKERQRQHSGTAPGRPGNTPVESNKSVREALAEKAQVSTHKIQQTEVLAKKAPELLPRVAAGEMKLKDAVKEAKAETAERMEKAERAYRTPPASSATSTKTEQSSDPWPFGWKPAEGAVSWLEDVTDGFFYEDYRRSDHKKKHPYSWAKTDSAEVYREFCKYHGVGTDAEDPADVEVQLRKIANLRDWLDGILETDKAEKKILERKRIYARAGV